MASAYPYVLDPRGGSLPASRWASRYSVRRPVRKTHLARVPAVRGFLDASAKSRRVRGGSLLGPRIPRLSACSSGQWTTRCSGVSGPVPQRQSGVAIEGTRRCMRKALRPILPVRIWVRVALSCFRRPLCLRSAAGPKSGASAGLGRRYGCLTLAASAYLLCLAFQSRSTASLSNPSLTYL